MIKKTIKAIGYLVFLLFAVVILLELGARQIKGWSAWVDVVDNPDHRMLPNSGPDINSDGIRSRREAQDFRSESYNVVFLGDSFTYGLWLGDKLTIPHQFEKLARKKYPTQDIKTANFGWISSSPLLSYRLLQDIGKDYQPDLVIQILDMTDVGDDLYYSTILNRQGIFTIGRYIPSTTLLLQKLIRDYVQWDGLSEALFGLPVKRYFIVQRTLEETRYAFDFMWQHIDATEKYVREELGARYVLFILPRYFQYNPEEAPQNWEVAHGEYSADEEYAMEPFRYFSEMSKTRLYPVISLVPDFKKAGFQTVFDDDAHLNDQGAKYAARAIFSHCQQVKCFTE